MKVIEFYEEYCQGKLKVMSAYNGKILCKRFDPEKHIEVGERELSTIWAEIEAPKHGGFNQFAMPIIFAYVDGSVEYEKEHQV